MKYLCKVIKPVKEFKIGEEVILPQSVVRIFKDYLEILKVIKEKPEMIIK